MLITVGHIKTSRRMNSTLQSPSLVKRTVSPRRAQSAPLALLLLLSAPARASLFKGEALDTAADVLTWVVLVIAPVIAIAIFWLVHILPEKIAEKRKHPQAKAIQTLCLLSLAFGGMLWPLAWLWAYSKPVLYKMAYGTDTAEPEHETEKGPPQDAAQAEELMRLRETVTDLQAKLVRIKSAAE